MSKFINDDINFLWQSFLNGDDKSFSVIYKLHIDPLISYGYKLCINHEMVHDCLQEIFIDLFLKRTKLNVDIKNLKAYLFIALRNCLVKKITKNKKFEFTDFKDNKFEFNFDIEYSWQEKIIEEENSNRIKEILQKAIKKLPPKQKEIIYLKFEEELKYTEISEIMGISIDSARKLLYRALLSLRSDVLSDTVKPLRLILFFLNFR